MRVPDDGACRAVDPIVLEPAPGDALGEQRAKRYCHHCPVRLECLALALRVPHLPGIWGGLTERERAYHRVDRHDGWLQQPKGGRAAADQSRAAASHSQRGSRPYP